MQRASLDQFICTGTISLSIIHNVDIQNKYDLLKQKILMYPNSYLENKRLLLEAVVDFVVLLVGFI